MRPYSQQNKVLAYIYLSGGKNITTDEIASGLNISKQSIKTAISYLMEQKLDRKRTFYFREGIKKNEAPPVRKYYYSIRDSQKKYIARFMNKYYRYKALEEIKKLDSNIQVANQNIKRTITSDIIFLLYLNSLNNELTTTAQARKILGRKDVNIRACLKGFRSTIKIKHRKAKKQGGIEAFYYIPPHKISNFDLYLKKRYGENFTTKPLSSIKST